LALLSTEPTVRSIWCWRFHTSSFISQFAGSLYTGMLNSPFTPLSPAPLDTVVGTSSLFLDLCMMLLLTTHNDNADEELR
jgi:hypothetical protein